MPEFQVGDSAEVTKTITADAIEQFAAVTGDTNPLHLDDAAAAGTRFGRRIAHGMLSAGLISAVIGTKLPGFGAIYTGQTLRFLRPVFIGDTITASVTVRAYDRERGRLELETVCRNQNGEEVVTGEAGIYYRPPAGAE